ncbi:hypothetical protein BgiMline_032057, partial [Biomphalaria glabrata]
MRHDLVSLVSGKPLQTGDRPTSRRLDLFQIVTVVCYKYVIDPPPPCDVKCFR